MKSSPIVSCLLALASGSALCAESLSNAASEHPDGDATQASVAGATARSPDASRDTSVTAPPEAVRFEPIANVSRSRPLGFMLSGGGPLFTNVRWVEGQPRKSVDPRSPYYYPGFSR